MKASPTRGIWYAVGGMVEHGNDAVADICDCRPVMFGQDHLGRSDAEITANARLIAEAPTMLRFIRKIAKDQFVDLETRREARRIIGWTRGER